MSFSAVATTALPKENLAYKWVINDAKVFFEEVRKDLRSPLFSVLVPTGANSKQMSKWYLCVKLAYYPLVAIHLCQEDCEVPGNEMLEKEPQILVSGCNFSLVGAGGEKVFNEANAPPIQCVIGKSLFTLGSNIENFNIDDYLHDGSVTVCIQVTAILICISAPIVTNSENSHIPVPPNDIQERMKHILDERLYADITIKCGDEAFRAHKAILAMQSPVFKKKLQIVSEMSCGVIEISDIEPAVMTELLNFLYTGEANLSKTAVGLLNASAADKYDLPRLFAMCENELMITLAVHNVVDLLLLAEEVQQATALKEDCLNLFKYRFPDIRETESWKNLRENPDCDRAVLFAIIQKAGIN